MSKNEIATQEKGGVPAAFDYGEDGGVGFEGVRPEELSVPFLSILQSNSPQVEAKDPEGSEAGMLFNTVTRELAAGDEGVVVVPVHKDMAYVEWVPRSKGGGFVGLHEPSSDEVKQAIQDNDGNRFGKLKIGENDLVETYYVYCLILDDAGKESLGFAVLSFTSTKIKPHNDWITAMYTLKGRPPLFANRAKITTIKQKNEHGTFYNFRINPFGGGTWRDALINPQTEGNLLAEAKDFRDMVVNGLARAAFETQNATGDAATGSSDSEAAPF